MITFLVVFARARAHLNLKQNRGKIIGIMVGSCNIPGFYIVVQAMVSLYALTKEVVGYLALTVFGSILTDILVS